MLLLGLLTRLEHGERMVVVMRTQQAVLLIGHITAPIWCLTLLGDKNQLSEEEQKQNCVTVSNR